MAAKKQAILEEYEKRKRLEKEAHSIVEELIESPVAEKFFLQSVVKLTREHYEDVTTERSISKLCGYCLCTNTLKSVLPQKHKIVKNRVYDITERKKFCSDRCYAISCKILDQISTTPLWLRDYDVIPEILIDDETDKKGEEILLWHRVQKNEVEALSKDNSVDSKIAQDHTKVGHVQGDDAERNNTKHPASRKSHDNAPREVKRVVDICQEVFALLENWISEETAHYLLGYAKAEKKSSEEGDILREKEDVIQEQLDRLILGSNTAVKNNDSKPVPEYKNIESDVKTYETKVFQFYGGSIEIRERESKPMQIKNDSSTSNTYESENRIVREKLVMNRLKRLIDDLTPPLPDIRRELRELLATFNLTSKNVVVSVDLWPVVTISLVYLLCNKNAELNNRVSSEEVERVFQMVLKVYNLEPATLKSQVSNILHPYVQS